MDPRYLNFMTCGTVSSPIFTSKSEFVRHLLNLHSIYSALLLLIRQPCASKACPHQCYKKSAMAEFNQTAMRVCILWQNLMAAAIFMAPWQFTMAIAEILAALSFFFLSFFFFMIGLSKRQKEILVCFYYS